VKAACLERRCRTRLSWLGALATILLSGGVGDGDMLAELLDALGAAADDLLLVALVAGGGAEILLVELG